MAWMLRIGRARGPIAALAIAWLLTAAVPAKANPYRAPGALPGTGSGGRLGSSASLSGDASVAVVGEPGYDGDNGAALVYANADRAWRLVQRLQPTGESGTGRFGAAVSMDHDGRTLVVGAPDDAAGAGAAWVFALDDSGTWTQPLLRCATKEQRPNRRLRASGHHDAGHEPLG